MSQQSIKKAVKALKVLQDATQLRIEATQISFLLHVYNAGDSGLTLEDLGNLTGIEGSSRGRTAALFTREGARKPRSEDRLGGWDLVSIHYDALRPRSKVVRITAKGSKVVEKYLNALDS